ncbi:MAG TPA: hypothetical protein VGJ88_10795 [Thermoanaerobaculia bacterium]|jgi:hypothetical protein
MTDDPRETFEWLGNEYAQALQALTAIENQASTIVAFGGSDDLRTYIDQFIVMATQTRGVAEEKGEAHFVEWFSELIAKAEALRVELVRE